MTRQPGRSWRGTGHNRYAVALAEARQRIAEAINEQKSELDLSDLDLTAVPPEISQAGLLRYVDLSGNRLQSMPAALSDLTGLEVLDLSRNQITTLSASIGKLTRLHSLDLSRNLLTALPAEIGLLWDLRHLGLADNFLVELPQSLQGFPALDELYIQLHGNPTLGIAAEFLGPDIDGGVATSSPPANAAVLLDVYRKTRAENRALNEAKVILVGFGEVGKTSLVKRLVHDRFDTTEKKTDGISVTDWQILLYGNEEIKLHIWDFGGQEIMHSTHQFFLTQRSLYVLVLNGRGGRQQHDATYWLSLIASRAPESPVIIVRNKIKEYPCQLDRVALRANFPAIRAFVDTDCLDGTGIDDLSRAMRREIDALPELRNRFPPAWFAVKDRISAMTEDYLSIDQYRKLCSDCGEATPAAQDTLAGFLHCLGLALNFRDDPQWLAHSMHVLNPRWVTEGVYAILNHDRLGNQGGELYAGDLAAILDAQHYPPERYDFLLQLLRRFELAVPFPEQHDRFLVPERLPWEAQEDISDFDPVRCLNFEFIYPTVLPEGLVPRFIVRTHILSVHGARWRSGVVLRLEGNRALVVGDTTKNSVRITIDGPPAGRRRLLGVIRHDFDHIHRSYQFQPQSMVLLPGAPSTKVPYDKLLVLEQQSTRYIPEIVDGQVLNLDVRRLLDGVDLSPPKTVEPGLRRETEPCIAFISYAHKDETLRVELDTHLKPLQITGELDAWHDRSITPGEKWEGRINDNLQRASIVLLLLSPDFIASDYCRKEMEIALQREAAGQTRVMPVIVRPCGWQHLPVQANQALPKDGKPVADAGHEQGHRDTAWVQVEDGIRRTLKAIQPAHGVH
jgi:internalin A